MARENWIDALKGISIAGVVAGHIWDGSTTRDVFYLWHMPLFFFLSGYIFRPNPDLGANLADKALRLLVPYCCYLVLIGSPELFRVLSSMSADAAWHWIVTSLLGGRLLSARQGAFWFITCLFLTLQIFNLLVLKLKGPALGWLMLASIAVALVPAVASPETPIPWDANVCLASVPIMYAGWRYRHAMDGRFEWPAFVVAVLGFALLKMHVIEPLDMKQGLYGTPVLSLVAALGIIVALFAIVRRAPQESWIMRRLAAFGQGSLVIMFLHFTIQTGVLHLGYTNHVLRFLVGFFGAYACYELFLRTAWTRAFLIGSVPDLKALSRRFHRLSPAR